MLRRGAASSVMPAHRSAGRSPRVRLTRPETSRVVVAQPSSASGSSSVSRSIAIATASRKPGVASGPSVRSTRSPNRPSAASTRKFPRESGAAVASGRSASVPPTTRSSAPRRNASTPRAALIGTKSRGRTSSRQFSSPGRPRASGGSGASNVPSASIRPGQSAGAIGAIGPVPPLVWDRTSPSSGWASSCSRVGCGVSSVISITRPVIARISATGARSSASDVPPRARTASSSARRASCAVTGVPSAQRVSRRRKM